MTANEFVSEIIKPGSELLIEGKTISERVHLSTNIQARGVIIKDCTFEGVVTFNNMDINCGIVFEHCTFKESLTFNSCKAENYDNTFNANNSHLRFSETTINLLHFNGDNKIKRGVNIDKKSEINKIFIKDLNSVFGGFSISESIINEHFDFFNVNLKDDLRIQNNSKINCKFRVDNLNAGAIAFSNSDFSKDVHVSSSEIPMFNINNSNFTDDLYLERNKINSDLTLIDNIFSKSIFIQIKEPKPVGFINEIFIKANNFGEHFILDGGKSLINQLTIESSKKMVGALHFKSCNIQDAILKGENYNSSIVFKNCDFNKLLFDSLTNYANISLTTIKTFGNNSQLEILDSNLGKLQIFNTDLNSFEKIIIISSVLIEVSIANVVWFNPDKLKSGTDTKLSSIEQKREVFRQIKTALENQGDRITALKFKALEMKAFKDQSFNKVAGCRKIFSNDRFILFAGQSNNFGQSWLKPVLITIPIIIVFYIFIVIGISEQLSFCPNFTEDSIETTLNEMISHSYILPKMFNPTSNLADTLPENTKLSFVVSLFDYLSKIVLAFFIFQIVSAFRKFMK
ncbi:MAG: hypothetical protein JXR36_04435 [Bacteroidales bacterium]|nr:hypothetical protein [Bacteroidales bacterium]